MLTQFRLGAALVALLAAAAGVWWVMDLKADRDALAASVAALSREVDVAKSQAEQAADALAVAQGERDRLRQRVEQYDDIREWILRGDDNAPMPDLLRDLFDRLFNPDR